MGCKGIAVGPDGTVYVTWDYGPERTSITYLCAKGGSCPNLSGNKAEIYAANIAASLP